MSRIEDRLAADQAARTVARQALDQRVEHLRAALAERTIKGRLVDEAMAQAQAGANEALEIARDSRWVLVATVFALVAWCGRQPLGRAVRRIASAHRAEPQPRWRRWLGRISRKVRP